MVSYTTVTDVSNELNGLTIDGSSTPSSTIVEAWIEDESDLLKRETGRLWGQETITDEYLDYDGGRFLQTKYAPIISITKFENERNGINASSENWLELTEGRTASNSFIVYKDEGELQFHGTTMPYAGYQNCRLTYVAGYATVNPTAKAITTKRVALRVIESVVNGQAGEEGGSITVDVISLSDPTTFSANRVKQLKNDLKELVAILGKFKTYRLTRR